MIHQTEIPSAVCFANDQVILPLGYDLSGSFVAAQMDFPDASQVIHHIGDAWCPIVSAKRSEAPQEEADRPLTASGANGTRPLGYLSPITPLSRRLQGTREHRRYPRYPAKKWNEIKPILESLYLDQGCPLSEAKRILEEEHNFKASLLLAISFVNRPITDLPNSREKQYKSRMRSWGVKKNATRKADHSRLS